MTDEESIRAAVTQRCQHYYELEADMGDRPCSMPLAIMKSLNEPNNYVMSEVDDEVTKALDTSCSVKLVPTNAKRNAENQEKKIVWQQQHLVRIRIIVPATIRTNR